MAETSKLCISARVGDAGRIIACSVGRDYLQQHGLQLHWPLVATHWHFPSLQQLASQTHELAQHDFSDTRHNRQNG